MALRPARRGRSVDRSWRRWVVFELSAPHRTTAANWPPRCQCGHQGLPRAGRRIGLVRHLRFTKAPWVDGKHALAGGDNLQPPSPHPCPTIDENYGRSFRFAAGQFSDRTVHESPCADSKHRIRVTRLFTSCVTVASNFLYFATSPTFPCGSRWLARQSLARGVASR